MMLNKMINETRRITRREIYFKGKRMQKFVLPKLILVSLVILIVISQVVTMVMSMYIPRASISIRRQDDIDSDGDNNDEELDSNASAPYQNQDGAGDGYEDSDKDGPYEESPRDEEGQADLERFFDDHLGASEKEGMDKENLPSNRVETTIVGPNSASPFVGEQLQSSSSEQHLDNYSDGSNHRHHHHHHHHHHQQQQQQQPVQYHQHHQHQQQRLISPNKIETTKLIQLPNNKLIITRQITQGPVYKGGLDLPEIPPIPEHLLRETNQDQQQQDQQQPDNLKATGTRIYSTENDELDRVFVTRLNDEPFKIDALGGYDPEEDFNEASKDLDESSSSPRRKARDSEDGADGGETRESQRQKDISFNDPDVDTLFEDASETDEVTFDRDQEPYETDLEAEIHTSSYNRPGVFSSGNGKKAAINNNKPAGSNSKNLKVMPPLKISDDDSEGSWVNDGADDMDIPSQSDQDVVLAKAAKQEELARRAAEEEGEAEAQQAEKDGGAQQQDPESQRMANADYLKDDLKLIDDDDEAL